MSYRELRNGLQALLAKFETDEWVAETLEEVGHPIVAAVAIQSLKDITGRVLVAAGRAHFWAIVLAGVVGAIGVVFNGSVVVQEFGVLVGLLVALLLAFLVLWTYNMMFSLLMIPVANWLKKVAPLPTETAGE